MSPATAENHLVVGATAMYDALAEAPTAEEEAAMDDLDRARKAKEYEAEFTRNCNETPLGLNRTLQEVIGTIESIEPGFNLYMHDAFARCDYALIGRLLYRARDLYLHDLTRREIGA